MGRASLNTGTGIIALPSGRSAGKTGVFPGCIQFIGKKSGLVALHLAVLALLPVAPASLHAQEACSTDASMFTPSYSGSSMLLDMGTLEISGASDWSCADFTFFITSVPVVGHDTFFDGNNQLLMSTSNTGTLVVNGFNTYTEGGTISLGSLQTSGGTLALYGTNTFYGSTAINGSGTIGAIASGILNDSNLSAGTMTNSSGVLQMGSGTLTLGGGTGNYNLAVGGSIGVLPSPVDMAPLDLLLLAPTGIVNIGSGLDIGTFINGGTLLIGGGTSTQFVSGMAYSDSSSITRAGGLGTTVALVGGIAGSGGAGVNGGDRNVSISFLDAEPALASDIVALSGTSGTGFADIVVLQLTYNPAAAVAFFGAEEDTRLGWLDPSSGEWVLAVEGNTGTGSLAGFYAMSYVDFLNANGGTFDSVAMLGAYGIDVSAHTVWAVVNHNSEFASIPEPSAWMLITCGSAAIVIIARRKKQTA